MILVLDLLTRFQHTHNIPPDKYNTLETSLELMSQSLDEAANQSNDQPDIPYVAPSTRIYTGRPGRPRVEINPGWLQTALDIRGGTTSLGTVFGCAPRTVRRRALELGLVEPGPPVYVDYVDPDGLVTRIYRSSTRAASDIDDEELDRIMASILQVFPSLGRRMIDGHLRYLGHAIPRPRLQASYARVHGAPSTGFGPRRIQRRVYNVAGPNSLWHHDGQHGKKYKNFCDPSELAQVLLDGRLSFTASLTVIPVLSLASVPIIIIVHKLFWISSKTLLKCTELLIVYVEIMELRIYLYEP